MVVLFPKHLPSWSRGRRCKHPETNLFVFSDLVWHTKAFRYRSLKEYQPNPWLYSQGIKSEHWIFEEGSISIPNKILNRTFRKNRHVSACHDISPGELFPQTLLVSGLSKEFGNLESAKTTQKHNKTFFPVIHSFFRSYNAKNSWAFSQVQSSFQLNSSLWLEILGNVNIIVYSYLLSRFKFTPHHWY